MLRSLLVLSFLLLAAPVAAQSLPPEQAAIKAHVQFLAADAMRGRATGSPEFDIAAEYMAAQMLGAGLAPGGEKAGWFQPVRIVSHKPAGPGSMALRRGSTSIPMVFGTDFVNGSVPSAPDLSVSGPVVFAGYGIVYPEGKRDDYRGLDVRGKVVAILPGVPPGLPNEVEAHLGDDDQKARFAEARGAKAVIVLESAERRAEYGFEEVVSYYDFERATWAGPDGRAHAPAPGSPVIAYVSQIGAAKMFAGARIKWADVLAAEAKGARIPTGPLAVTLDAASRTRLTPSQSRNVVGLLEGSDPELKKQYIVLSAHLDHVGVGDAVAGDTIYNGAMDNAVGNAMLVEIARRFQASGERPRRSILFVSLAAEEIGLIGSAYFAHHPPVPRHSLVANLNIDMPILTYPLVDLVALGGERSSLGPTIAAAAATEGLKVVPDPAPEEMFFVRSDHYSFVQSGIPAVSVDTGPGGTGAAAQKLFLAEHYHQPSDQIGLPFDWESTARYMRVTYAAARMLADADDRPRWNKGDFFGVEFGGYGAK